MKSVETITRRGILSKAWPIILANAAVPTLGLVDTAIIGNVGSTVQLGAIALGAVIFSFMYWSFGFLRMGTTGFTAQASGAGDEAEVRAILARALLIAFAIGGALMVLQWPLAMLAFYLLDGSPQVEAAARDYFIVRIWAAPATLATFALLGTLIALGRSRTLLVLQLILNGLNIILDIYFAGVLDMGAKGIALGTAIAEWTTCLLALVVIYRILRRRHHDREALWPWRRVLDPLKIRRTVAANSDILVRTLTLVFGFAWFANQGASFGDSTLAANHILLQLIAFSAFFLDGYAFVVESLVGTALGARKHGLFTAAVRLSSELALATAAFLAAAFLVFGDSAVQLLTNISPVQHIATSLLPWCALYVLLATAAFQLDGVFIGATRTREMRSAALFSIAIFLIVGWPLTTWFGNAGLWWAFIAYAVARALTLAFYYPRIAGRFHPITHPD
ncbi:MAG: MATE family efflux transporter [Pirellulales bacterium]